MKLVALLLGVCYVHQVSLAICHPLVIHSHQYIYTGTSGIDNFPEFVSVGLVDGQQISYYDSKIKEMIPKQQWVEGAVDADFWKRNGQNLLGQAQVFSNNINIAKERFNHTGASYDKMSAEGPPGHTMLEIVTAVQQSTTYLENGLLQMKVHVDPMHAGKSQDGH
ncbi:major histocompatibility complex class I-related protein 1-like isoform X2 [Alosa pseudoharengus]|uniref:major histocompatibility complex class I-related protein 1-like isoform X2 n=1 Tax=Alosa pseudoharengus TaxID=34774 RepID=UPI003F89FB14